MCKHKNRLVMAFIINGAGIDQGRRVRGFQVELRRKKIKKLKVILATPVILALTIVLIIAAAAQDKNTKIQMDNADQNWSSISGLIIAHHDLQMEPDPWENLEIYEILDFIDESIKKRTLLGYESDPIYGEDPLAGERLNLLKTKIKAAGNALENGTFEEVCQWLLETYLRCDGLSQQTDLVYGPAIPELAEKIKYLRIEIIGCE
jgi:hypothetical protein